MKNVTDDQFKKLIEVWKTLEVLTVSVQRIGRFHASRGEEKGKQALLEFFEPSIFQRIATSRHIMVDILEHIDPDIYNKLEEMSENEADIGYWNGLKEDE